jgi:hypothetical protein
LLVACKQVLGGLALGSVLAVLGDARVHCLPQKWPFLIEIAAVELGKFDEFIEVQDPHLSLLEADEAGFAQVTQDPVDVDRAEPERIGQHVLRQRTGIAITCSHPHQLQSRGKFEQEMRHALMCITPTDADQVLDHHRLVARRGPKHRGRKARIVGEGIEKIAGQDLRGLDRGDRFYIVVSGPEENRSEPEEVSRNLEIDDLSRAVVEQLVGADPAVGKDISRRVGLATRSRPAANLRRRRCSASRTLRSDSDSTTKAASFRAKGVCAITTGVPASCQAYQTENTSLPTCGSI